MKTKTLKIVATVIILLGSVGGLMYTSLSEGTEYYKHVDEVMANPAAWHDKNLQLHGFVVKGTWMQKPNTLEYQFKVENKGSMVAASYTGILPDTFKDEAEVVLKGRLTSADHFQVEPNGVMAKCPSKYEEAKPGFDLKSQAPSTSTSN